ncbi:hypothetical protein ACQP2U_43330 (plasmid) [Nocardia sp. CA-084685]|uniref:hypothetical protein n=1 Tax=Nocardia sp. CA-084685 TaxID=3239970 RepID=UPI003D97A9EC
MTTTSPRRRATTRHRKSTPTTHIARRREPGLVEFTVDPSTGTGHAVIELPYTQPVLTMNTKAATMRGRIGEADKAKDVRHTVYMLLRAAKLPQDVAHVVVWLHYQPVDNRTRDTDNLANTTKPIYDAFTRTRAAYTIRTGPKKGDTVEAQLGWSMVRDDDPRYMSKPEPKIHDPVKGEPGRMWLDIRWVTHVRTTTSHTALAAAISDLADRVLDLQDLLEGQQVGGADWQQAATALQAALIGLHQHTALSPNAAPSLARGPHTTLNELCTTVAALTSLNITSDPT